MRLSSFEAISRALQAAGVRYIIAGGLAVNAHGYSRFTKDVDIAIQFVPENVDRFFAALGTLGYRPAVPVTAKQFADAKQRERWINEKNMAVLQFWSDNHRETSVDVFVTEPFDFEAEYQSALVKELSRGLDVRFVSLPTLIRMKEEVARPEDLLDVQHLKILLEQQYDSDSPSP
jgi:hypothetical protein